jgi:hypothetical protein
MPQMLEHLRNRYAGSREECVVIAGDKEIDAQSVLPETQPKD